VWIYYDYALGIEFVDARGTANSRSGYDGDFFGHRLLKLGTYIVPRTSS